MTAQSQDISPSEGVRPDPVSIRNCGKHILPCCVADVLPRSGKKLRGPLLGKLIGHLKRKQFQVLNASSNPNDDSIDVLDMGRYKRCGRLTTTELCSC